MQGTKVIHTCMKICKSPVQYQNVTLVLKSKIDNIIISCSRPTPRFLGKTLMVQHSLMLSQRTGPLLLLQLAPYSLW